MSDLECKTCDTNTAEPVPPKIFVVTEGGGRERRFTADGFSHTLLGITVKRDEKAIAFYPTGSYVAVREDGATVPDATARALDIAKRALEAVTRISDPNVAIQLATDALGEIFTETE
jgi:hypothetical protein